MRVWKRILPEFDCPIYWLKDGNEEVVADCISAALGGNSAYDELMYVCRGTGSLYFTPEFSNMMFDALASAYTRFNNR